MTIHCYVTASISHIHLPLASLIITLVPGLTLSIVNSHRQPLELRVLSPFQECSEASSEMTHFSLLWPTKRDANLGKLYPGRALSTQVEVLLQQGLKSSVFEHPLKLEHSTRHLEGRGWWLEPLLVDTGIPHARKVPELQVSLWTAQQMCASQEINELEPLYLSPVFMGITHREEYPVRLA